MIEVLLEALPSSVASDFKAWPQAAGHAGPGHPGEGEKTPDRAYSPATVKLCLAALTRLLRFWWFRGWLSFSPEEEREAHRALQVQRSGVRRGQYLFQHVLDDNQSRFRCLSLPAMYLSGDEIGRLEF